MMMMRLMEVLVAFPFLAFPCLHAKCVQSSVSHVSILHRDVVMGHCGVGVGIQTMWPGLQGTYG